MSKEERKTKEKWERRIRISRGGGKKREEESEEREEGRIMQTMSSIVEMDVGLSRQ